MELTANRQGLETRAARSNPGTAAGVPAPRKIPNRESTIFANQLHLPHATRGVFVWTESLPVRYGYSWTPLHACRPSARCPGYLMPGMPRARMRYLRQTGAIPWRC